MSKHQHTRRAGVYCWLRSPEYPATSFFLPLPEEDNGKTEKTRLDPSFIDLSSTMWGVISGAVDEGETSHTAVIREAVEEKALLLNPQEVTNSFPTITVARSKNGVVSWFNSQGYVAQLPALKITQLRLSQPVLEVKDEALERFLAENRASLRPHVFLVGHLLLRHRLLS